MSKEGKQVVENEEEEDREEGQGVEEEVEERN